MDRFRGSERSAFSQRPWMGVWLAVAYCVVVATFLASGLDMEGWDDSYFFKRIGINVLEHGSVAWNVQDGPVYGNTSQGYQLFALIPLLIDSSYYISIIKILLALSCVLLFVVLLRSVRALESERTLAQGFVFLAASAPYPLLLIHSGMETCLGLFVLAVNLLAIRYSDQSRRGTIAVVATTLLVYLTRPDAVLISLVSIGGYYWLRDRRPPWRILAYCGLALLAVWGLFYLYFDTPLPLSFYLKSRVLTVYTDDFVDKDLILKRRNLTGLLVMAAPFLYVAAHGRRPWTLALVVAFIAFITYHYFSTVEIMSYYARFYVPSLVPVALAALAAVPRFRERSRLWVSLLFCVLHCAAVVYLYQQRLIYDQKDQLITRVQDDIYLSFVAAAAVLLIGARVQSRLAVLVVVIPILVGAFRGLPMPDLGLRSDEVLLDKHIDRFTTVRGIRSVRECVPEPFHMYHTEIGIPGILFPRSTVTDMAGLMDTSIALRGMDFEQRCMADRPEVLFLPHRVYKALRQQISRSACFRDYRRVVKDSSSPLYIRKDLSQDFLACAKQVDDRWIEFR